MELFQIWVRVRHCKCSHTETIYLDAENHDDADKRAYKLFGKTHTIKAVLRYDERVNQVACGCGTSITHVCDIDPTEPSEPLESDSQYRTRHYWTIN
jgi:hypothetical protein